MYFLVDVPLQIPWSGFLSVLQNMVEDVGTAVTVREAGLITACISGHRVSLCALFGVLSVERGSACAMTCGGLFDSPLRNRHVQQVNHIQCVTNCYPSCSGYLSGKYSTMHATMELCVL